MPYNYNTSDQSYFIKSIRQNSDLFAFQLELQHMENLRNLMVAEGKEHLYSRFFPRYFRLQTSHDIPSLYMEKLYGETLEAFLCKRQAHNAPACLLPFTKILHIYEQLHEAASWLIRGNMLHLDVSPQNIILTNDAFDLKFVDFTGCYYTDLTLAENIKRGYSRIDHRVDPGLQLSRQLRDSYALLFTRLFFSGKDNYTRYFSSNRRTPLGQTNYLFFQRNYPSLLRCIFTPDDLAPLAAQDHHGFLADWECWYQHLIRLPYRR